MSDEKRLSMPVGEAMFTQRSIRKFKPDPVAIEDIHLIIDAASKAPNGGNRQVARFLVLTDRKKIRDEFGPLYYERGGRSAVTKATSGRPSRRSPRGKRTIARPRSSPTR